MDHVSMIRRIAFFLVGLALGGWSVYALAETMPATQQAAQIGYYGWVGTPPSNPVVVATRVAACNQIKASGPLYVRESTGTSAPDSYCRFYHQWSTPQWNEYGRNSEAYTCDGSTVSQTGRCGYTCPTGQGWTLSGQTCTRPDCESGQTRGADGQCRVQCPAAGSQVGSSGSWYKGGGSGLNQCIGGCSVTATACVTGSGSSGVTRECQGPFTASGESCSTSAEGTNGIPAENQPTAEEQNNQKAIDCLSKGQEYGTVNGVTVCSGTATNTTSTSSTTSNTTNPDGSTTGSTSSSNTTCTGDKCTTTTTTTESGSGGGGGGGTSTTTKTESRDEFCKNNPTNIACKGGNEFCKQNPNTAICKESKFTGSCEQEPSCDGDAATCAIAKATWINKCAVEELKKKTAVSDLFNDTEPLGSAEFQSLSARALNKDGEADFDIYATFQEKRENYLNFTSSCPAYGLSFELKGRTYNFDTEFVCQLGEFVRLLMHIAAYMMVARLLARTFA
jgi:hypothetical protein